MLKSATRAEFDGILATSYSNAIPASKLILDGDIKIQQRAPFPRPSGGIYKPYTLAPVASLDAALSADAVSPVGIISAVSGRNYSLAFSPTYAPVWIVDSTMPSAFDAIASLGTQPRSFTLDFTGRVPLGPVLVRPSIASELKYGWIQYAALLAVTSIVAWLVRRVLFGLYVVETTVLVDATQATAKLHLS